MNHVSVGRPEDIEGAEDQLWVLEDIVVLSAAILMVGYGRAVLPDLRPARGRQWAARLSIVIAAMLVGGALHQSGRPQPKIGSTD